MATDLEEKCMLTVVRHMPNISVVFPLNIQNKIRVDKSIFLKLSSQSFSAYVLKIVEFFSNFFLIVRHISEFLAWNSETNTFDRVLT